MATILKSIPKEANITKIDYEGPRIALYTDKPKFLMEHNDIISNLVNVIKKRIVIRTDEKIRKSEEDARKILDESVPKDADCLLYTSPSPRDRTRSRMPSSA